ncbi:MAG: hypothetical protein AB1847_17225 [bacterium]
MRSKGSHIKYLVSVFIFLSVLAPFRVVYRPVSGPMAIAMVGGESALAQGKELGQGRKQAQAEKQAKGREQGQVGNLAKNGNLTQNGNLENTLAGDGNQPQEGGKKLLNRIDFGNSYILGQSIKSGAVYLLQRKKNEIKSMLSSRNDFRNEVLEDFPLRDNRHVSSKSE